LPTGLFALHAARSRYAICVVCSKKTAYPSGARLRAVNGGLRICRLALYLILCCLPFLSDRMLSVERLWRVRSAMPLSPGAWCCFLRYAMCLPGLTGLTARVLTLGRRRQAPPLYRAGETRSGRRGLVKTGTSVALVRVSCACACARSWRIYLPYIFTSYSIYGFLNRCAFPSFSAPWRLPLYSGSSCAFAAFMLAARAAHAATAGDVCLLRWRGSAVLFA